ncbi:Pentatricopeptide repeat-containing protein [Vitis vinifera]|uniref:Pentatricopeptide repeat-containing protein n=1 Tax=Vitis vinifera TaxID=29760 RepID=A0A438HHP5_VITVI|nr:Pentatricopeptide repeat-containing protein [Vitis vinifera]
MVAAKTIQMLDVGLLPSLDPAFHIGKIDFGKRVLCDMPKRDSVSEFIDYNICMEWNLDSWNTMFSGHAKIEKARSLFMQMGNLRDQSSWNIMIARCGMNSQGREACELVSHMEKDGYKLNSITFTSLLSTYSHSGLIEEGCWYFDMMMRKYKIQLGFEQWTCIIDMYA